MKLAQNIIVFATVAIISGVLMIAITALLQLVDSKRRRLALRTISLALGLIGMGAVVGAMAMLYWLGAGNPLEELFAVGGP
jgi:hypothetical protein